MKPLKFITLFFSLSILVFSCKKDENKKAEKVSKIKSFSDAVFSYNEKGDALFIDKRVIVPFESGGIILRSSFEYQNDGKISSFTAMGYFMNYLGAILAPPTYRFYDYSYPTPNQTIIKFSEGLEIDRSPAPGWTATFKLTKTDGLLTLIEILFDDLRVNRLNSQTNRIEITYSGKNPSTISMYKLFSPAKGVEAKWILVEKHENFKYDKFVNPLYVAFNGQPNFHFIQFGEPDYYSFINLYSISVNNPLSVDIKYYDRDGGSYLYNGVITYNPEYDANHNMTTYEGKLEKLPPYDMSYLMRTTLTYY